MTNGQNPNDPVKIKPLPKIKGRQLLYCVDTSQLAVITAQLFPRPPYSQLAALANTPYLNKKLKKAYDKPTRYVHLCHDLLIAYNTLSEPLEFDAAFLLDLLSLAGKRKDDQRYHLLAAFVKGNINITPQLRGNYPIRDYLLPEEVLLLIELTHMVNIESKRPTYTLRNSLLRALRIAFTGSYDFYSTLLAFRKYLAKAVDSGLGVMLVRY